MVLLYHLIALAHLITLLREYLVESGLHMPKPVVLVVKLHLVLEVALGLRQALKSQRQIFIHIVLGNQVLAIEERASADHVTASADFARVFDLIFYLLEAGVAQIGEKGAKLILLEADDTQQE